MQSTAKWFGMLCVSQLYVRSVLGAFLSVSSPSGIDPQATHMCSHSCISDNTDRKSQRQRSLRMVTVPTEHLYVPQLVSVSKFIVSTDG